MSKGAAVATTFSALSGQAVLEVQQLSGGSSNPSWRVTTADGVYATRFYDAAPSAYSQAQLLSYLLTQGVPVPEVAFVGTYGAHHFLALSWVQGLTVAEALRAHPDLAQHLGRLFGEAHARLHAVSVTPELRAALQLLGSPEQPVSTPVLLHLDYHLLNVLTDGSMITGVLDWENVRLGDARYDAARSLSILCADPSIRALPLPFRQVVRAFRRSYVRGYQQVMGEASLMALAPFLVWSGRFMLDDLKGRSSLEEVKNIERWSAWWQHRL